MQAMKNIWEYVTAYRALGWVVLPAKVGVKYPMVDWKRYQNMRPTDEEYKGWFIGREVNVCLVTGKLSGVMVIDLDTYKKTYAGRGTITSPVSSTTARGGTHLFFKYNDLYGRNKVSVGGIDIRGEGGIIVLPPSTVNGVSYKWNNEEGTNFTNLPEFEDGDRLMEKSMQGLTRFSLEDHLEVGEGLRNDSLFKVACNLIRNYKGDLKTAYYFTRLAGEDYRPALPAGEIKTIFRSAVSAVARDQNIDYTIAAVRSESPFSSYTGQEIYKAYDSLIDKVGTGISTGFAALDTFTKLYPEHLYMVTAGTHIGKTSLAISIATRVAIAGSRVLFFSLEDGLYIQDKIKKIAEKEQDFPLTLIDSSIFPKASTIFNYIQGLKDKPDFVVIDHIHFIAPEERTETVKDRIVAVTMQLKLLTKQLHIPIMCLVHIRKQDKSRDDPPVMDDMKDAQELAGLANVVLIMHRARKKLSEIKHGHEEYFEQEGVIKIAKAKVPGGKTGTVSFSISNNELKVYDWTAKKEEHKIAMDRDIEKITEAGDLPFD